MEAATAGHCPTTPPATSLPPVLAAVDVVALPDPLLASRWVRAVAARNPALIAACEAEAAERGTSCTAILAAAAKKPNRFDAVAEQTKATVAKHNAERARTGKRIGPQTNRKWDETKVTRKKGNGPGGGAGGGQFDQKSSGGGGGGGGTTKTDPAAKAAAKDWDTAEALRKAEAKAADGNFASLITIAEHREAAARKAVDLAADPKAQRDAQINLDTEQAFLADVNKRAAAAKDAKAQAVETKKTATKAERDKVAADKKALSDKAHTDAKTVSDKAHADAKAADVAAKAKALADAQQVAERNQSESLATLRKQYTGWEDEVRRLHAGDNLSEAAMNELVLRDRIRRLRSKP